MNIGIVGYGNIAKKHQAAIAQLPGCQLKAVYDLNPLELGAEISSHTELQSFYKEKLDLVSICTPNGLHTAQSISTLQAGYHVICEKPLALTPIDCQKIIDAADNNKKQVFCTMQNRFSPVSQWLKTLMETRALGDIFLVNVACYWNRNKAYYAGSDWRGQQDQDGGTLFTQFSHYVDSLYWLFGPLNVHHAAFSNFDHGEMIDFEDTAVFNFNFEKAGMGSFTYTTSCYEKNFESSMVIIGSKGTIKVGGQYMDRIDYCNVEGIDKPTLAANDNVANIAKVYQNAIAKINGQPSAATTAQDGLAVVDIIENVYKFKKAL